MLNISDTAAGKVVKCSCGKSLQVPGAPTTASAATVPAPRQSAAASKPAPARTPQPATAATQARKPVVGPGTATKPAGVNPYTVPVSNDFDLTETDLAPVRGVMRPGQSNPAPKTNENELLRKYTKEEGGYENSIEGAHPATLKSMGGSNFMSALFDSFILLLLLGFTSAMPIPRDLMAAKGVLVFVMSLFGGLDIAFLAGAGVSCFLPYRQCWFFLLFAYSFGFMMRLTIFISAFRWESSWVWIMIVSSWLIFSGISLAYLHSNEVRKFYETRQVSKSMMFLFDGIGILIGGMLLAAFFLVTRSA